jgi:hypothetical protein
MIAALDAMPWAMPAILTVLVGTGAILRRHGRHARAASIVMAAALVLLVAWIVLGIMMALGAIA